MVASQITWTPNFCSGRASLFRPMIDLVVAGGTATGNVLAAADRVGCVAVANMENREVVRPKLSA